MISSLKPRGIFMYYYLYTEKDIYIMYHSEFVCYNFKNKDKMFRSTASTDSLL